MSTGSSAAPWRAFRTTANARLAGAASLELDWYPQRVRLTTDDQDALRAFRGELYTSEPGPPSRGVVAVRALIVDDAVETLADRLRAGSRDPRQVVGYDELCYERLALDGVTVWISPDENALGKGGNRHIVVRDEDGWWVVSGPGSDGPRHGVIMVRELMRVRLLNRRGTVLHASSVVSSGAAILFSGDGGSGKTTLALASSLTGAALMSGDRTAAWAERGRVWTTGVGLAVRARDGTLRGLGLDARVRGVTLARSHPTKVIFSQVELGSVVGVPTAVGAPLAAVVFTERGDGPAELDELTPPVAAPLLHRQVMGIDNAWTDGWLEAGPGPRPPAGAAVDDVLGGALLLRLRWDPTQGGAERVAAAVRARVRAAVP